VSSLGSDLNGVLRLNSDSVLMGVVYFMNRAINMVVMVDNSSLIVNRVEPEIFSIFFPVGLSGGRNIRSSGVESGVVAQLLSGVLHGCLVGFKLFALNSVKVVLIVREFLQDFLLESASELFAFIRFEHNLFAVGRKLIVEVLNNVALLVLFLSSVKLSVVFSSDGFKLLGFDLTTDLESVIGSSFKFILVSSDLLVDFDESHLTFVHFCLSGVRNFLNVSSVSLFVGCVDHINLLSVGSRGAHSGGLELLKLGGAFRLTRVFF